MKKFLLVILILTPILAAYPANLGPPLPVTTASGDQQNPSVTVLEDKKLWLVVWEDWRSLDYGPDIYGAFVKEENGEAKLCGGEFVIYKSSGLQTYPAVAYSSKHQRALVVWQDSSFPYLKYRFIDVSNLTSSCSGYKLGTVYTVPFSGTITTTQTPCPGRLSGSTCVLDYPTSREKPKVVYSSGDGVFWIAWVEHRNEKGNIVLHENICTNSAYTVSYGDQSVVGYGGLRWDNYWVKNPDIVRTTESLTQARRVEFESGSDHMRWVYEYFPGVEDVALATNEVSGEIYLVWSSRRRKLEINMECTEDENGVKKAVWTSTDEDNPPGNHIFGLPGFQITKSETESILISGDSGNQFSPSISYDPITRRYLVAWENSQGSSSRVQAVLLSSVSGTHYTPPMDIDTSAPDWARQTRPSVGYDYTNQRFFVVWQDGRASPVSEENLDIWGRFIDAEGSLRGESYLVSTSEYGQPAKGNQYSPKVSYSRATHRFLVVWKDARNYTSTHSDIYAQLFSLGQPQMNIYDSQGNLLSPSILDFGQVTVGSEKELPIVIKNTGDAALRLFDLSSLDPPFSYLYADPALLDGDEDTYIELPPGGSVSISVLFSPTKVKGYNVTFVIHSNAGDRGIFLQGSGVGGSLSVTREIDFGSTYVGSTSTESITIENHGDVEATITNVELKPCSGYSYSPFEVQLQQGTVIQPGETKSFNVTFTPEKSEDYCSILKVYVDFSEFPFSVTLKGKGFEEEAYEHLEVSPDIVDFGSVKIGDSSSIEVTIKNKSSKNIVVESILPPDYPFKLSDIRTPITLLPGKEVYITISFQPSESGQFKGELGIETNYEDVEIPVKGKAVRTSFLFFSDVPSTEQTLFPGQSGIWIVELKGKDVFVTDIMEPIDPSFEFTELLSSTTYSPFNPSAESHYIYALYLKPGGAGLYIGKFSIMLSGGKRIEESFKTKVVDLPSSWGLCSTPPALNVSIDGKKAVFLENPSQIDINISISWSCSPEGTSGDLFLAIVGDKGILLYDPISQYFVEDSSLSKGLFSVSPPLSFKGSVTVDLEKLGIDEGVYKIYLALRTKNLWFWDTAAFIVKETGKAAEVDIY